MQFLHVHIDEGSVVSMASYLSHGDQQLIKTIPNEASHDKAFINKIISFTVSGAELIRMSPKDAVNWFADSPILAMIRGSYYSPSPSPRPEMHRPFWLINNFSSLLLLYFARAAMYEDRVYNSSTNDDQIHARLEGFTAAWKKKLRNIYEYERYKCSRFQNKQLWIRQLDSNTQKT